MSVFGAVFGRRGDGGFSGPLLGVSSGVVGFSVAMFLRPVRVICRPARPCVGASAKKFALRTKNGSKWAICGVLGEFFRGRVAERGVLGGRCRAVHVCLPCRRNGAYADNLSASGQPIRVGAGVVLARSLHERRRDVCPVQRSSMWRGGGFARHDAVWGRVVGVSEPHVVQFPPFGGGEAAA